MRPAPFEYHRATSVENALELLAEFGEDGRPLAGGQSLVPMMNLRLARPSHLVDINGLPLDGIERVGEVIRIGSLVRHVRYFDDPLVRTHLPALHEAVHSIGHPTIRGRGTLGGSISHADPTAELPAVCVLYDAMIVARSQQAERRIPATEFFLSAFTTALEPGEMVVAVEFPIPAASSAGSFVEFAERRGDFATASIGVALEFSGEHITRAAVVCSGADLIPVRARSVESHLTSRLLRDPDIAEAGRLFAASVEPLSDHITSAAFRRSLIGELTRRAVETACARALGST